MSKKNYDEIRQGSVVQTTGPGAMTVLQRGVSVMIPGLDAWYLDESGKVAVPDECILLDSHLSDALGVTHFVQPPAVGLAEQDYSSYLNVFVFPRWAVCYTPGCKTLVPMGESDTKRPNCPRCLDLTNKKAEAVQVNFVIACEAGHLDEFPWEQWVHKSATQTCSNPRLTLKSKGSGDLRGQVVSCICGAKRTLAKTSEATEMQLGSEQVERSTFLSSQLDQSGAPFLCTGSQPWLRRRNPEGCSLPVRMILRNSNNIYYGAIESSILVPVVDGNLVQLVELIKSDNKIGTIQAKLLRHGFDYQKVAEQLITVIQEDRYEGYTLEDVTAALELAIPKPASAGVPVEPSSTPSAPIVYDRGHEWTALLEPRESEDLVVRETDYVAGEIPGIRAVNAIARLKETRALKGFSRIKPIPVDANTGRDQLRRKGRGPNSNWFPAVRNVGEGIFIDFDLDALTTWEKQEALKSRIGKIEQRLILNGMADPNREVTPRLVLLHTLAHVLIQELVIECGYTAASLRERVYSNDECAGFLIYTASPDADGTMGGLVEMADAGTFRRVFSAALENASWCSNDPVCMELGAHGQGTHGTNLAACHSCCLLPETSCEMFNQSLDRAVLVGDLANPGAFNQFFA